MKGVSGTLYFVDEDNLGVWTIKDGQQDTHLCIVDDDYSWDEDDEALQNDRIAKRLLMLAKDKKVAREIYDKGDKVDTHWLEIQEARTGSVVV